MQAAKRPASAASDARLIAWAAFSEPARLEQGLANLRQTFPVPDRIFPLESRVLGLVRARLPLTCHSVRAPNNSRFAC